MALLDARAFCSHAATKLPPLRRARCRPIFFIPMTLPFAWWLDQPNGLRGCTLVGFALVVGGCICRLVATTQQPWSIALLHLSYVFNAVAGPVAMGCVSKVAENWFPAAERATATAIAAGVSSPQSTVVTAQYCRFTSLVRHLIVHLSPTLPSLRSSRTFPSLPPNFAMRLSHALHCHPPVPRASSPRLPRLVPQRSTSSAAPSPSRWVRPWCPRLKSTPTRATTSCC